MRKFDYSFLSSISVPSSFLSAASRIYSLSGLTRMMKNGNPELFSALEKNARVDSVRASNAIEGVVSTEARISAIVSGFSSPETHDEEEIAGYRDALNWIHTSYRDIQISEGTVKELHRLLFASSTARKGGDYKKDDNVIMDFDASGRRNVRFVPVRAEETPSAMKDICLAYREARDEGNTDSLLLIPCFVLDFLCIHPFSDGNGRVSRLLTLLLFYKAGFDVGRYISYENAVDEHRAMYYEALKHSSEGWSEGKNDYTSFIHFNLLMLALCYDELGKHMSLLDGSSKVKSGAVEKALRESTRPISKKEIMALLPSVSVSTIEAELGRLVKSGVIEKVGSGPATKYRLI